MKTLAALLLCMLMTICMYGQHKTLSLQYIDSSTKPGDDFYMYANGKWYDTATIPATESRAGARIEMDYTTRANIKSILEEAAAAHSAPGTIAQKVGDFFASGMDTVTIEKLGYQPVQKLLDQINALKNGKDVMRFVAEQYTYFNTMLIGLYVSPDDKNSTSYLLQFYQAGLVLPDRDYYFKTDASTQDVVKAYQTYIIKLFMLTGDNAGQATKHMNTVYALEKHTADMGGVAIAYNAFKLTKEGRDTTKIDGLTPDQRFFLAFAQSWRKKVTDQSLQQQVKTDPHSPGFFRVKGPLMNFTPFYTAFNVQAGDKMYKPQNERITIW